jgi:hypothetical protein
MRAYMLDLWATGKMSNKGLCDAAFNITKSGGKGLSDLNLDPNKTRPAYMGVAIQCPRSAPHFNQSRIHNLEAFSLHPG